MVDDHFIKFKIQNETTIDFYRYMAKVYHCNWVSWLPEKLAPKIENLFSCEHNRGHFSCSFDLQYNVVINELEYVIQFKYDSSSSSSSSKNNYWTTDVFVPNSKAKLPINLITIDRRMNNKVLTFVINPTHDGKIFIKMLKLDIMRALERLSQKKEPLLNQSDCEENIRQNKTDPFKSLYWNVKNIDWKLRLRKSHRSIMIRIVNLTKRCMCLVIPVSNSEKASDITLLEEGFWIEFPSEQIPPMCGTEFGCRSSGFFNGTRGRCIYKMIGEPGHFVFWWEQAPMGSSRAGGAHSNNMYTVVTHVESLNESTAFFHITHSNCPPLIATQARAICGADVKSPYSPSPNVISSGISLTPIFIQHIKTSFISPSSDFFKNNEENRENHNNEINLFSPRTFFSRVLNGMRYALNKKTPVDSWLYLEWMIGNEKFSKAFHPDERIKIHSSIIGGMDDTQLIMNSQLVLKRLEVPEIKYKYIQQSLSMDGETRISDSSIHMNEDENVPVNIRSTISEEELLENVLMCFNSLCQGLQPIIAREMKAKFGEHWIEVSKLPPRHIWVLENEKQIDLEGVLYIVTAYWHEVFESIFENIESIQLFQTASIYWANQEIDHFDSHFVWDLVTKSIQLLKVILLMQKLKATRAAKHIYFIQQRMLENTSSIWMG